MLVAFEGIDGACKTTVMKLLKQRKNVSQYEFCEMFESPLGGALHEILENKGANLAKKYSLAADWAWIYENKTIPALKANKIVIWNHYADYALAYRYAEENSEDSDTHDFVHKINIPFKKPDLTFYFHIDEQTSRKRTSSQNRKCLHTTEFLRRVNKFYENKVQVDSTYIEIDASQPIEQVYEFVNSILQTFEFHKSSLLKINHARADMLVRLLNKQYYNDSFFLGAQANLIGNQVPKGVEKSSKFHARFLYYIACNDHGLKSNNMYEKAKRLYEEHSEYFDPNTIINLSEDDIFNAIVKRLGARYPNALLRSWIENTNFIIQNYGGEPINLFTSTNDAYELLKNIKKLRGYGPKISGMLVRAIHGLKFNPALKNMAAVLVPVDIHDARILFKTGVFSVPESPKFDYYDYVLPAQKELLSACNRNRLDWTIVDKALWLIGSHNKTDSLVRAVMKANG
ncbi:hypothetical protein LFAB_07190 [Lactiplantibacillus fabifermentans T30PCM01]|uniref:Thymidylate kinase n=1 Tax=Lactiplantibacillus fabifermentans T30PCM01 TaxID=1400520 RepID=W6T8D8_9LACO|nr:dTMP kinase [Lactiplantibacillus fabifermentans]ETY74589.1 hypothetical protein LFAB_07190 [Lactiplantibacillus fabifermentans T30PCM01]